MSIKVTPLFFFLMVSAWSSPAQIFEGKITYQNTYKSKLPNVSDEQFTAMLGTIQEYYIKNGNYRTTANGTFFQWQIYLLKDNKLYNKLANSESLYWIDAAANTDEVIKSEINKNATTVLGYTCDELILTCKSGVQKYYFTSKIGVDPKLYANFHYQNWSAVMSNTKALPLKMIIDNQQFTAESVALEIGAGTLDDSLFVLPANAKLEKSPY